MLVARRFLSVTARRQADLNRITLLGRVAGDANTYVFDQTEHAAGDVASVDDAGHGTSESKPRPVGVVNFTLATNRYYRNKDKDMVAATDWHRVKQVGRGVVEYLAPKIQKGSTVLVEGQLRYDTYTNKEGVERTVGTVYADKIQVVKYPMPKQEQDHGE